MNFMRLMRRRAGNFTEEEKSAMGFISISAPETRGYLTPFFEKGRQEQGLDMVYL